MNQHITPPSSSAPSPSAPSASAPSPAAGTDRPSLSRRTAIAGAAWAVPAISLLAASPAAAASTDPPVVLVTPATPTLPGVARCSVIPASTIRFAVTVDGVPAKDGGVVHVTLPDGLQFVGWTDPHEIDLSIVGGAVTVPAVRAVGALGAYSVNATYATPKATGTGAVTVPVTEIAAGALFTWSQVDSSAPVVKQDAVWPLSRVVAVANNAFVAVDPAGRVSYWGDAFAPNGIVGTMSAITGITKAAVWSTLTSRWYAGILVTDGVAAWYATSSGQGALSAPTRLTGFTGAILDVRVHDNALYLLTTDGVFYGGGAMNGSSMTALRGIAGSAGATHLSTWCTNSGKFYTGGVFVMPSGKVYQVTANAEAALSTKELTGAPLNITDTFAGDNAVAVLTADGRLFTIGNAFRSSTWQQRYTGIAGFSGWTATTANQVAGLAMLTRDGGVLETFSASNWDWMSVTVAGLTGKAIVDVVASDGFYQALDSSGTVWIWTGNADGTVSKATALAGQPAQTVSLKAFGVHTNAFYGYGIGIASAVCPV
ncbi:hypothetical protein P5G50_01400 [Leifsonia sp. F6_8S_P_1B]|uniref:Uncharacterized protein n=1 Tax=Leifsonia williamsii TaxID=3035919 RepID=A0ABT8K7W7_9MICO|nr:hypothetical protein [Leifsonia williamsii]MDN4613093.1 hypothetical protein [Leifsonia williamsii]